MDYGSCQLSRLKTEKIPVLQTPVVSSRVAHALFDDMKSSPQSSESHLHRHITSPCLLAAAVMPIIFSGTQIVARLSIPLQLFTAALDALALITASFLGVYNLRSVNFNSYFCERKKPSPTF
jgi:hypothetical protein